ncbi:MAG: flagellar biosynthesis protein FlhA [Planctomycetia bacterium]|nr:flagellar biosynthesis protein FlhA [Planctomycetia bacterium]
MAREHATSLSIGNLLTKGGSVLSSLFLPLLMAMAILVLIVPVPPAVLDLMLATNITVAILLLLATFSIRTPMELSLFPTLLLVTTLARLVLNVATTRQILTHAHEDGLDAAGSVIRSFGDFVTGGDLFVGVVIFAIIVTIQFLVITKGTSRISEVAARFTLDAMPGRQMSIDADLAAGFISDTEARRRRDAISRQADFFGAMDGASKFVRGDAVVGIFITLINIFGGFAIGVFRYGMSVSDASGIFTKLTIGDGLVAQIPALLISLAAGILVTRSNEPTRLSTAMTRQLILRPVPLFVAGGVLLTLIFTEMPTLPLFLLGTGCVALGFRIQRHPIREYTENTNDAGDRSGESTVTSTGKNTSTETSGERTTSTVKPAEPTVETLLAVDPMELELGVSLVPLADPNCHGDLLERIQRIRRRLATELGIVVPKIRIRDHMQLPQKHYRIRIDDVPVAEESLEPRSLLALDPGNTSGTLPGVPTCDPTFGTPALWIAPEHADQAKSLGFTVVDPASVLATHLTEVIRRHAAQTLSRESVQLLLDQLRKRSPASVDGIVPERISVGLLGQVLRLLLAEQVSIRPLAKILETLSDAIEKKHSPRDLAAAVRCGLAPMLSAKYRDANGTLAVITCSATLEEQMTTFFHCDGINVEWFAPPEFRQEFCRRLIAELERWLGEGRVPVLLTSASVRDAVKELTRGELPDLTVLAPNEITAETRIERLGEIDDWRTTGIPLRISGITSQEPDMMVADSLYADSPGFVNGDDPDLLREIRRAMPVT